MEGVVLVETNIHHSVPGGCFNVDAITRCDDLGMEGSSVCE